MRNFQKALLGIVAGFALFFNSCSTDFELNAPWEDITVVYGLINQADSIHYIKINKAYLGEGNAFDYATVRDSSEYSSVAAVIQEWDNGSMVNSYTLKDTLLANKEEGLFYYPEQKVYYFVAPNLNEQNQYKLVINLDENGTEKEVTSTTELVREFDIQRPMANFPGGNSNTEITFASSIGNYAASDVEWVASEYGKLYSVAIVFHYIEETSAGDLNEKSITLSQGSVVAENGQQNQSMEIRVPGEKFYQAVADRVDPDPNVVRRIVRGLDFIVSVAGEELYTYMQINEPATGIVQEKPTYTNIENGIGLFGSRYLKVVENKYLTKNSIKELAEGSITGHLMFCSDTIIHQSETYYCP